MADEKISEMTVASTLGDTDIIPIVQSGSNKIATPVVVKSYVLDSPILIGTKARLVALNGPPGGVKLQVKNASNVWEDVWSYTAST